MQGAPRKYNTRQEMALIRQVTIDPFENNSDLKNHSNLSHVSNQTISNILKRNWIKTYRSAIKNHLGDKN